MSETT